MKLIKNYYLFLNNVFFIVFMSFQMKKQINKQTYILSHRQNPLHLIINYIIWISFFCSMLFSFNFFESVVEIFSIEWRSDYSCSESPHKGLPPPPQGSPVVKTQEGFVTVNTFVGRMVKTVCLLLLLLLEKMGTPEKAVFFVTCMLKRYTPSLNIVLCYLLNFCLIISSNCFR